MRHTHAGDGVGELECLKRLVQTSASTIGIGDRIGSEIEHTNAGQRAVIRCINSGSFIRHGCMGAKLAAAAQSQNQYLAAVAVKELESQKERLAAYSLQARYALASIYDRASSGSSTKGTAQ